MLITLDKAPLIRSVRGWVAVCHNEFFGLYVILWSPAAIYTPLTVVMGIQKLESLANSIAKG